MTLNAKKQFADNLSVLFEMSGMTKEEFSRRVGVSCNQIHVWMRGRTFPQLKNLSAIARALGVGVKMLLKGVDNKEIL